MTGLIAGVAFLLTLIGLYGVLAFYVHRRTHELGVRVAMGAGSGAILGLVVWRGLMLVGSLACLLPGWRAIRLDPVRAIQSE